KDLVKTFKEYKKSPENLKEIIFSGNEDVYYDAYSVFLGQNQTQTIDNINFTNEVKTAIKRKMLNNNPVYYLDGHSLGGAEAQTLLGVQEKLFKDVNVYNDAPANIYNLILSSDYLLDRVYIKFKIDVREYSDLNQIPTSELRAFLDREIGHNSSKITYYRNEEDILTNTTLPWAYRFINERNTVVFNSIPDVDKHRDLATEHPAVVALMHMILNRANKDKGLSYTEMLLYTRLGLGAKYLPGFMQTPIEKDLAAFMEKVAEMDPSAHSMASIVEQIAKQEGKEIINNQWILTVKDAAYGEEIKLNINASYDFYVVGHTIVMGKEQWISQFQHIFHMEVTNDYSSNVRKVLRKMDEIESNPHAYLSSFNRYTADAQYYVQYTNFRFLENVPQSLTSNITNSLDDIIQNVHEENRRQQGFLERFKAGVKKLVQEDARVSLLFDTFFERRGAW
ncbi:MAG TPA: DUF6792 domain-containing protein, partial [Bacillaceae bacterium]